MNSLPSFLSIALILNVLVSCSMQPNEQATTRFDIESDLLLLHYDCKTDVDDLHSVAAAATLLNNAEYSTIKYHAVAGAYGTQDGLYVPPNDLFNLAFGDHWSDAHTEIDKAVNEVTKLAVQRIEDGGDIWIAEAGQSDFSARVLLQIRETLPEINTSERINIVQHSDWNEEVTTTKFLEYVKEHANYQKIPDGNGVDNGTPGYRTEDQLNIQELVDNKESLEIWQKAIEKANAFNGKEDRYLNQAIRAGGFDFSDFSEVWWILELENAESPEDYMKNYGTN